MDLSQMSRRMVQPRETEVEPLVASCRLHMCELEADDLRHETETLKGAVSLLIEGPRAHLDVTNSVGLDVHHGVLNERSGDALLPLV